MNKAQDVIEKLSSAYTYRPDTGDFVWAINPGKLRHLLGRIAGSCRGDGYRRMTVGGQEYMVHRLVWLVEHGVWPQNDIDHVNGVRSDNRVANLRDVPRFVNIQNRKRSDSDSKTGVLGVSPNGSGFVARIKAGGRQLNLGTHRTVEDAHAAYLSAKREVHVGNTL